MAVPVVLGVLVARSHLYTFLDPSDKVMGVTTDSGGSVIFVARTLPLCRCPVSARVMCVFHVVSVSQPVII